MPAPRRATAAPSAMPEPRHPSPWRLAADRGGTFTDCAALTPSGEFKRCKVLSSGILRARIAALAGPQSCRPDRSWDVPDGCFVGWQIRFANGPPATITSWQNGTLSWDRPDLAPAPGDVLELSTGEPAPVVGARLLTGTPLAAAFPPMEYRLATTLATNALLEGTSARPVLFITAGFPDLLIIGDQRRADLFALGHHRDAPLHGEVVEVTERLDATGNVLVPLDRDALASKAAALAAAGCRTAAIALAHSDVNPAHERAVAAILQSAGFTAISISSDLAPVIRLLPRAQTAVVNAALAPVMARFVADIRSAMGPEVSLRFLTSAGGLAPADSFRPCDSLLSGPAGGVAGAAALAMSCREPRVLTLDMGGTSTDVARSEGRPLYQFEQRTGRSVILAPALSIETVAAGGGSVCDVTAEGLTVGPRSAGANPGPACYGRGGPLTLTDVNLLLGRLDPDRAGLPLDPEPARIRLAELRASMAAHGLPPPPSDEALLRGLLDVAVSRMAEAVRRISVRDGCDPSEYSLVAFGGAGPQHACAVADQLGIRRVLVSRHAGLLSACGALTAPREAFAVRQILQPLRDCLTLADKILADLRAEALASLAAPGTANCFAQLRLAGQDSALTIPITAAADCAPAFTAEYTRLYGSPPPSGRAVELVSLRAAAATVPTPLPPESFDDAPVLHGPDIIQDGFSTLVIEPGWEARKGTAGSWQITRSANASPAASPEAEAAAAELFRARLQGIADAMGELLRRTAVSTNVKERLDYSCAVLDAAGRLVVNAPHIPVHLGALGECVRRTAALLSPQPGDVFITNDPACGGSHLPDVTVICPVFTTDGTLAGYTANRAHHAEIGGITPGSMPPAARSLAEEGVVIPPQRLAESTIADLLRNHPWPSRAIPDNLADLRAQVASARHGADAFLDLCSHHGLPAATRRLHNITAAAARAMARRLAAFPDGREWHAASTMDDGTPLRVRLTIHCGRLSVDFSGSGPVHPGNRNATPAIVRSALLYVLRLWIGEPLPLNEGLFDPVDLILPEGLLNPPFADNPAASPAVVGGNVETSQRVVELLITALGLEAASQGTMNNVIFGSASFGHYETIGGGTGAGPAYDGLDGVHSHMTNTAITDVEIIERRYPVRITTFKLRHGSGGLGLHRGGDGLIRSWHFLAPLTVSLLTEHRTTGPQGLHGGTDGAPGRQWLTRADGHVEMLPATTAVLVQPGDTLTMETPGGGAWGV